MKIVFLYHKHKNNTDTHTRARVQFCTTEENIEQIFKTLKNHIFLHFETVAYKMQYFKKISDKFLAIKQMQRYEYSSKHASNGKLTILKILVL